MPKSKKLFITLALLLTALLFCGTASASGAEPESTQSTAPSEHDTADELARQAASVDLTQWQSYFEEAVSFGAGGFKSASDLLLHYAQSGADSAPQGVWELLAALLKNKLLASRGLIAALTASALFTSLANAMPQKGVRSALSFFLGVMPAMLTASAFAALCSQTADCINKASGFIGAALPVMTSLLAAVGATASAGVMRPLMLFLSGTLVTFIGKVIMPLIFAGGLIGILNGVSSNGGLSELYKLMQKAVKWLMGLASALYFGLCAVQGMTAAAADGVSVRTAKYAVDRLLPSSGGLVGGSLDTFLSCAALVKNGAGAAAIVIMLGLMIRPLASLAVGALVFRVSAALSRPAASPAAAGLMSAAADMTSCLFAAAAAVGAMFAVTVLVFIAAGGAAFGLL